MARNQHPTGDFLAQCLFAICLGGLAGVLFSYRHRIASLFEGSKPTIQAPAPVQKPAAPEVPAPAKPEESKGG
jgi:hypothetical protein